MSIRGLDELVTNGTIGPNTVVIANHGHGQEIVQRLSTFGNLRVEAEYQDNFETVEGFRNGQIDAESSLDQAQTYVDSTVQNQARNGRGGTTVLSVDAHGYDPARETMPSAEDLRRVMGPNVNIVFVNEAPSGRVLDPTDDGNELSGWLRDMKEAGIPVQGFGIDARQR